jgi:class 3 adenylate cyclase
MPLPSGNVTFLFGDIEGSTRLASSMPPDDWAALLRTHDALVDASIAGHGGSIVKHEGDGTFAAFAAASDAVDAAVGISRAIAVEALRAGLPLRVRIGLHTGMGRLTDSGTDYLGIDVHYAARLASAANGGQVVLSEAARSVLTRGLPAGATLISVGPRRLKDFDEPRPVTGWSSLGRPTTSARSEPPAPWTYHPSSRHLSGAQPRSPRSRTSSPARGSSPSPARAAPARRASRSASPNGSSTGSPTAGCSSSSRRSATRRSSRRRSQLSWGSPSNPTGRPPSS